MTLTAARQVADAVLYEGYLLYPYRASSAKNQVRWQFGVLGPEGAAAAGVGEPPGQSAELVLEASSATTVDVLLRFLHVQSRVVEVPDGDGWSAVPELQVGGTRWIPFHEAVPCEVPLAGMRLDRDLVVPVTVPGAVEVEELHDDGRLVGRLVRTREALSAAVALTPRPGQDARLTVLGLAVTNALAWQDEQLAGWTARDLAARTSLVGTHLLVTARDGRFVSLLEGPDWADPDTQSRTHHRCWPVLIADDDGNDAVLVAPIVLGDHPRIAPESAGDLFDATEIDEILTLRVLTMTDDEKAEARGTDPRAAAILDRCEALPDAALGLLHGARRDADPQQAVVHVAGVPVRKGSRVLLRPTRRADAHDLFLAGMTAVVARVDTDLDGSTHVAVMLEDDPGADLYDATGRYYYFAPDEVEPLQDAR